MKNITQQFEVAESFENPDINGTHGQGYIECKYSTLKKLFGNPEDGDGYKIDAQWIVGTPAGIATIYNYKDGKNYNGREGTATTKITDWHIGGNNINVLAWITACVVIN